MKKIEIKLGGLTCANCAGVIDEKIKKMPEIEDSNLNFTSSKLVVGIKEEYESSKVVEEIYKLIDDIEPGLDLYITKDYGQNIMDQKNSQRKNKGDDKENIDDGDELVSNNRILMSSLALYLVLFLAKKGGLSEPIFAAGMIVAYLIAGREVIYDAFRNLFKGKVMDENFLMTIATFGAIAIGEYPEAVGVMIFYGIGEILEDRAVDKSRKNISELMNIKADITNVFEDGIIKEVKTEEVKVGQTILVRPGEKVPLDSTIIKGSSSFDNSAITGESKLIRLGQGDEVLSGTINKEELVHMKVDREYSDSTVAKILDMVENASSKKSRKENFITTFAKYYTPVVVALALSIGLLVPILTGQDLSKWVYRGLIFLVVSCPCALVLSIPLSYFSGIGVLSKNGVLLKGSNYIDVLRGLDTIVFDKTGTLTEGVFKVRKINVVEGISEEEILKYAYIAEKNSTHPIAKSIVSYVDELNINDINMDKLGSYKELSSMGIKAVYENHEILAGNSKLMDAFDIDYSNIKSASSKVYLAVDGKYHGCIEIFDDLKANTFEAIESLRDSGVNRFVMLTGDAYENAEELSKKLNIDEFFAELLPNQKVEKIEELLYSKSVKSNVAFVGDGINDAPVIARADLGISMGQIGSDAAIEASDLVLMKDDLRNLSKAIDIAKYTNKIVIQNIVMAIGIKVLIMMLSVFGLANMWMAIFADVGVALLAVLNSLRIFRLK